MYLWSSRTLSVLLFLFIVFPILWLFIPVLMVVIFKYTTIFGYRLDYWHSIVVTGLISLTAYLSFLYFIWMGNKYEKLDNNFYAYRNRVNKVLYHLREFYEYCTIEKELNKISETEDVVESCIKALNEKYKKRRYGPLRSEFFYSIVSYFRIIFYPSLRKYRVQKYDTFFCGYGIPLLRSKSLKLIGGKYDRSRIPLATLFHIPKKSMYVIVSLETTSRNFLVGMSFTFPVIKDMKGCARIIQICGITEENKSFVAELERKINDELTGVQTIKFITPEQGYDDIK